MNSPSFPILTLPASRPRRLQPSRPSARRSLVRAANGSAGGAWAGRRRLLARRRSSSSVSPPACRARKSCSPTSRRCRPTCAAMTAIRSRPSPANGVSNWPLTNIRRWSSTPSFRPRTRPSSAMAGSTIPAWSAPSSIIRRKSVTGGRAKGGSTITQQVAKYLLQDDEYAISRKIREVILAFRLEDTLSKEQILELYLNSIFLGRNAYGVQAASRAYFDKDVADLTLAGGRLSGGSSQGAEQLRSGPRDGARAGPPQLCPAGNGRQRLHHRGAARRRRRRPARHDPLRQQRQVPRSGRLFHGRSPPRPDEAASAKLPTMARTASMPAGCGSARSMVPQMQDAAAEALREGLAKFDGGRGWRDTGLSIDVDNDWQTQLRVAALGTGFPDWKKAVVLSKSRHQRAHRLSRRVDRLAAESAAQQPKRGGGGTAFGNLRPGMIIIVKQMGLEQLRPPLDPRSRRRLRRRGSPHRPGPGDAGRIRRRRLVLQSRDPGACASRARRSSRSFM